MSVILREAKYKATARKARGRLAFILRNGSNVIIEPEERERIRRRAQNTPYLDKMLAIVSKAK